MAGPGRSNGKSQTGRKRGSKGKKSKFPAYGSISNGSIKRIARRAGINRISVDSMGAIREAFDNFLDKLVNDSITYTECGQRKTIIPQDVVYALKRQGRNIYGYVYDKKPVNTSTMDDDKKSMD